MWGGGIQFCHLVFVFLEDEEGGLSVLSFFLTSSLIEDIQTLDLGYAGGIGLSLHMSPYFRPYLGTGRSK